jgi:hypothetical protein
MLLLLTIVFGDDAKPRAYQPGTPEFDELVKSIKAGRFTKDKNSRARNDL